MATKQQTIKILSIVEATTINAVAKNVLEFHRAARELAEQSADFQDIEECIVTFERTREATQTPNDFVNAARKQGWEVEIITERRRLDLSAIASLKNVVERQRPDIVVTHSVKSHFLLWRSQVWRDYPWVAFHHGYTTTDLKMRVYNWLDRWSLPHASRVLTVCHAFARELAAKTGVPLQQIIVQHNAVRPAPQPAVADVQSLRTQLGIAKDERTVLTVGRLSREKGHIDLLAAFKHLLEAHPDISAKLIIVGDGPERGRLGAAARADRLAGRVVFTGQISGDIQPYYAAADVFALPSHSEGSPNVLLEAMAANLPIVATAVGGVPEMVEDNESALLVPAGDMRAMAAAIKRVLDDEQLALRLTANASRLAAERYPPLAYARSLIEIYSSVSSKRASLPGSASE
ncbi:MAG: glycosyltransferase family 4 protein [Pyrinomonadaceae bacterium]|nr:glycosyltransferase family 4 protein [Pyrinomonadaceae bacterium]